MSSDFHNHTAYKFSLKTALPSYFEQRNVIAPSSSTFLKWKKNNFKNIVYVLKKNHSVSTFHLQEIFIFKKGVLTWKSSKFTAICKQIYKKDGRNIFLMVPFLIYRTDLCFPPSPYFDLIYPHYYPEFYCNFFQNSGTWMLRAFP